LEKLQGKQVAVKMTEFIIEENVACAVVELPKGGLFAVLVLFFVSFGKRGTHHCTRSNLEAQEPTVDIKLSLRPSIRFLSDLDPLPSGA